MMAGGGTCDEGLGDEALTMRCRYLDQTHSNLWG